MSLLAATCYLIAAIGFAYRRRWTWWLSVVMLGFELAMVLLIGGLSLVYPDAIGRTVWAPSSGRLATSRSSSRSSASSGSSGPTPGAPTMPPARPPSRRPDGRAVG